MTCSVGPVFIVEMHNFATITYLQSDAPEDKKNKRYIAESLSTV